MRPRTSVLVALLFIGGGLTPLLPAQAGFEPAAGQAPGSIAAGSSDFAVGDSGASMYWETTATGHRHVRATFDFGTVQTCVITYTAGGLTSAGRPHFFYAGHDAPGKRWGAFNFREAAGAPYTTHGHVLNVAITDAEANGEWFGTASITAVVSGEESFLFAGFNLRPNQVIPQANGKSLTIEVDCAHSFDVTRIEAGRDGFTFEPPKLRGGAGASTGIGPDASINVVDVKPATFPTGHVYYRYRADESAAGGLMRLFTPAGNPTILLTGDDDIFLDGPAGAWNTEFSRLALGEGQEAIGVVVALADVASLDAAAAL